MTTDARFVTPRKSTSGNYKRVLLGDVGAFGAVLGALSKLEPVISSLCLATHHRHTLAKQQKLPVHPGHAFEMKQKLAAHQGRTRNNFV